MVLLGVSLPPLGLLYGLHVGFDIPYTHLTRDVLALAHLPPYTGFLSNFGLLVWGSTAAICLFESARLSGPWHWTSLKAFLRYAGLFTLLLTLDDWYLVHEEIFPYLHIPEKLMYAFYAATAPLFMAACWRVIARSDYWVLAVALGLLAVSIGIDQVEIDWFIWASLLEDLAKFVGICAWAVYFVWLAWRGDAAPPKP